MDWSVLCRLLFLYLKAKSHRDGHSYCSSQGCERVKIQAATDSKDISNCMAKAYPQYYRKPSALKSMPSMLKGLCQGCGTRQVKQGVKVGFSSREKVKRFCVVSTFFPPPKHLCCPFILFFKFIFNWRVIVLQYCVGFCHISV